MNRRSFLETGAAAALGACVPPVAAAQPLINGAYTPPDHDGYDFLLARVCNNNSGWDFMPGGDKNFLEQFSEVVRCKVKLQPNVRDGTPTMGAPEHFNALVDLSNLEAMRRHPVLFMMGTGGFQMPPPGRLDNLRAYLHEGGAMLMDECASPIRADQFYQSSLAILRQIFPPNQIRRIPEDHEVYRNVYNIREPDFHRWRRGGAGSPGNTGVFIGERLAVFLCDADIHCGWSDPRNSWRKRADHRESIQTGINVYTYFLTH